jgi:hypothetical protein
MNAPGRGRIKAGQQPVQPAFRVALAAALQPRPQFRLPLRAGKEPFGKRAQVKPRSSGHDGHAASAGNRFEHRPGLPAVLACCKRLIRLGHIDQVVRQPRPLLARGLGRAQVHAAVDSHRVATDNLAAEALAQRERERRLAAPRRPQ